MTREAFATDLRDDNVCIGRDGRCTWVVWRSMGEMDGGDRTIAGDVSDHERREIGDVGEENVW